MEKTRSYTLCMAAETRRNWHASIFVLLLLLSAATVQAQWERIEGPPLAELAGILSAGDTITTFAYASHNYGHLWQSTDGGGSWTKLMTTTNSGFGAPFRMYSAFDRTWLTMTGAQDTLYSWSRTSGWNAVSVPGMQFTNAGGCVVGDTVFAVRLSGTNHLVMSGDPSGHDWTALSIGLPPNGISSLTVMQNTDVRTLFLAVRGFGIYRWEEGREAEAVSTSAEAKQIEHLAYTGRAFLAASGDVLLSSTDGLQWDTLHTEPGGFLTDFTVDAGNIYIGGYGGVVASRDSGKTWRTDNMGLARPIITGIEVKGARVLVSTRPYGVVISPDHGATWKTVGPADMVIGSFEAYDHSPVLFHFSYALCYGLTPLGWKAVPLPIDPVEIIYGTRMLAAHADYMYYFAQSVLQHSARLMRSSDRGEHWSVSDSLLFTRLGSTATDGVMLFASAANGILRSRNDGESWEFRDAGLQQPELLAAAGGQLYLSDGLTMKHSVDAGDSWSSETLVASGFPADHLIATDEFLFWSARSLGAFFRAHGESQFHPVRQQSVQYPLDVFRLFASDSTLYSMTLEGNIFRATTWKAVWESWDEAFPRGYGSSLLGIAGEYLYAADAQNGIWRRALSNTTQITNPSAIEKFTMQIWPQPAADLLRVSVLGGEGPVLLTLSDLLGRQVKSTYGTDAAHMWDISSLPSGAYLIRAIRGKQQVSRVVIKR